MKDDAMNSLSSALGIRILALLYFWYEFLRVIWAFIPTLDPIFPFNSPRKVCSVTSYFNHGQSRTLTVFLRPGMSGAERFAQARERLADDPGGAARGSRCGRARNLTPGYNDLLGRRPDSIGRPRKSPAF